MFFLFLSDFKTASRCLPVRFYLNDPKIKIQRGAIIEKDKENKTIGEFIKEVFPDLFNGSPNSQKLLKKTKVTKKNIF